MHYGERFILSFKELLKFLVCVCVCYEQTVSGNSVFLHISTSLLGPKTTLIYAAA